MGGDKFQVKSIGYAKTPYDESFTPKQPLARDAEVGTFKIILDEEYKDGLFKLADSSHIMIVSYMDKIDSDVKLKMTPSWTKAVEIGVFAARTPVRPNPIGVSIVKLQKVEGNQLFISPVDLYDNTPIIDIKPYINLIDSKTDANNGWIDDLEDGKHMVEHLTGAPHSHEHSHEHNHGEKTHAHSHSHKHEHSHKNHEKDEHNHDH